MEAIVQQKQVNVEADDGQEKDEEKENVLWFFVGQRLLL